MPDYSADADLLRKRPEILGYLPDGQNDWGEFHAEARQIIDRDLEVRWYRLRFPDWATRPFDPGRVLNAGTALTRLSCYKTLELIFAFLDNGAPESAFFRLKGEYAAQYRRELEAVLALGIDYDGGNGLVGYRYLVRG